jgi:hypothetical protein
MTNKIWLSSQLMAQVEFAAAEGYPFETAGAIVSIVPNLLVAMPITKYTTRTQTTSDWDTDKMDFLLEDYDVWGWFHSHPSCYPTISRARDFARAADKEAADENTLEDGEYELITGVWPGKRKSWIFKHRLYRRNGIIRQVKIGR